MRTQEDIPVKVNAKYVVFSLIGITSTYVLYHNERFIIDSSHPAWQHYGPFKWWLLPHAVFGAIVLLFAPLQFSDRLRKRFAKAHRVIGRFYVAGVFIGAPLGFYIQYVEEQMGGVIIRGLRAVSDFEFEFQLALMNRKLNERVETIFMMPKDTYTFLSSRIVKEIARLGGDVSSFVPRHVQAALTQKFNLSGPTITT